MKVFFQARVLVLWIERFYLKQASGFISSQALVLCFEGFISKQAFGFRYLRFCFKPGFCLVLWIEGFIPCQAFDFMYWKVYLKPGFWFYVLKVLFQSRVKVKCVIHWRIKYSCISIPRIYIYIYIYIRNGKSCFHFFILENHWISVFTVRTANCYINCYIIYSIAHWIQILSEEQVSIILYII